MIDYRPFCNSDPPQLVSLWHECRFGRGAADGFGSDAFETLNFSQPYFESEGLTVACDGERMVGFVHSGFGPNQDESALSYDSGVICVIGVHPEYRRQGIGRELVARAEAYLRGRGASELYAGPAAPRDPFYVGLYGGTRPAGFLESDPDADPFFTSLGYQPVARRAVYQRDISQPGDPVNFRLVTIRRKMELSLASQPDAMTWWWLTRFGRLDSLQCQLAPKGGGEPVAQATVVGLDLYLPKWQEQAIGITDLTVLQPSRRLGYGQMLLLEICRRMREELVTRVDASVADEDEAAVGLVESSGFQRIDTGIVYRR